MGTEAYGEKWPALPYDAAGLPGSSLSKIVTLKPFFEEIMRWIYPVFQHL